MCVCFAGREIEQASEQKSTPGMSKNGEGMGGKGILCLSHPLPLLLIFHTCLQFCSLRVLFRKCLLCRLNHSCGNVLHLQCTCSFSCKSNSFSYKRFSLRTCFEQRHKVTGKWPIQVIKAALYQLKTIHLIHLSDNRPESCDNGVILYILRKTIHYKVSTQKESKLCLTYSLKNLLFSKFKMLFFLITCYSCFTVNQYCWETVEGSSGSLE